MGNSRLVMIGKVQKPKGLKGEVKVTMTPETLARLGELRTLLFEKSQEKKTLQVERAYDQGGVGILKFAGIDTIEAAEPLRDGELLIVADELQALPEGVYYQFELVDFSVVFEDGTPLGRVREVIDYPSCDSLAVVTPAGQEILLPMTQRVILEVSKADRVIRVARAMVRELLA